MKTQDIIVTPKLAKKFLSMNKKNRKADSRIVEKYASDMSRGVWGMTHQGICFLSNGSLADGQHRLLAIIKSGVPIHMMITRGIDKKDAVCIDQGKPRTVANAIQIGELSEWIEPRDRAKGYCATEVNL